MFTINEEMRQEIIRDYNEALSQCLNILNQVDKKHGTYGVIEIEDIDITEFGKTIHQYLRSLEWREIRIQ